MFRLGMTSVTFRRLPAEEIIDLCRRAGLDGVEWGGDVHIPPGDRDTARRIRKLTQAAGLEILSYGSYYRLGTGRQPDRDFTPVLETARLLDAPLIRVWAGNIGSAQAVAGYYQAVAEETKKICEMTERYGIRVAYEYHPGTLTDCIQSARRLLDACGECGIYSLWQPRCIPAAVNLAELRALSDRLANLHVFYWIRKGETTLRRPLEEGMEEWRDYWAAADKIPGRHDLILEFVKDDAPAQLFADAAVLRQHCRRISGTGRPE